MLKTVCEQILLRSNEEVILKIIRNYTKEAGVRELERQLDKIIRKVVTQILVNNIKINKINIDRKSFGKIFRQRKI